MNTIVARSIFRTVGCLVALPMVVACGGKTDSTSGKKVADPPARQRSQVGAEELPSALPTGHPDLPTLGILSRDSRRMSISQLERSMDQIANLPAGTVVFPPDLAVTLGQPDYLMVTEESLEPGGLFMKFMMDLGGFYCQALQDIDATLEPADYVLTPERDLSSVTGSELDTALAEHIRYLLLRFTGIDGTVADPYVTRLRAVYDGASEGELGTDGGWQAVCIALITSPELLVY